MAANELRYSSYQGRTAWYMQNFGGAPTRVEEFQMEDGSTKLGVMVFAPSPQSGRDVWTFATNGMSERRMPCIEPPHGNPALRTELVAYASEDTAWVVQLLVELARYPFIHRSGFALGHTLPVALGHENPWCGYVLTEPVWESPEFNPLAIEIGLPGGDWVFFVQPVGLLSDELKLAVEIGGPEFCKKVGLHAQAMIDEATATLLDVRRPSLLMHGARPR